MIKHIVCFKLKDNSLENCQKTYDILMSMKGKVEMLKDIQVGIDFLHSER
ncbi:MAG: Dabb family protein, partial [Coprobacillus cateniformis]